MENQGIRQVYDKCPLRIYRHDIIRINFPPVCKLSALSSFIYVWAILCSAYEKRRNNMLLSKHCSMEMNDSQPEDTTAKRLSEAVSDQVRFPSNGNDTVKQEMAKALLVQGISEEAVCRLLHIDSEMLPDND